MGLFAPHSGGSHSYGVREKGVDESAWVKTRLPDGREVDAPAPSRYDVSRTDLLVVFPQIAVGFSPSKYLDIGASLQLAYGHFQLANANITPLGTATCMGPVDSPNCDAYGNPDSDGVGHLDGHVHVDA